MRGAQEPVSSNKESKHVWSGGVRFWVDAPAIEVHLSQPVAREAFRAVSYVSLAAAGTISGLGARGYELGIRAAVQLAQARAK